MAEIIEGNFVGAEDLRIGIVVSRFNEFITKALLEGALNELRRHGISDAAISVVWVPGAHEIPLACQTLSSAKNPDALVAISCIIRGETSHYAYLAKSVCDGIQKVALEQNTPIGFGVITAENITQAMNRAGGKQGNKGRDAAKSAIEMAQIIRTLKQEKEKETTLKTLMEREFQK